MVVYRRSSQPDQATFQQAALTELSELLKSYTKERERGYEEQGGCVEDAWGMVEKVWGLKTHRSQETVRE